MFSATFHTPRRWRGRWIFEQQELVQPCRCEHVLGLCNSVNNNRRFFLEHCVRNRKVLRGWWIILHQVKLDGGLGKKSNRQRRFEAADKGNPLRQWKLSPMHFGNPPPPIHFVRALGMSIPAPRDKWLEAPTLSMHPWYIVFPLRWKKKARRTSMSPTSSNYIPIRKVPQEKVKLSKNRKNESQLTIRRHPTKGRPNLFPENLECSRKPCRTPPVIPATGTLRRWNHLP